MLKIQFDEKEGIKKLINGIETLSNASIFAMAEQFEGYIDEENVFSCLLLIEDLSRAARGKLQNLRHREKNYGKNQNSSRNRANNRN